MNDSPKKSPSVKETVRAIDKCLSDVKIDFRDVAFANAISSIRTEWNKEKEQTSKTPVALAAAFIFIAKDKMIPFAARLADKSKAGEFLEAVRQVLFNLNPDLYLRADLDSLLAFHMETLTVGEFTDSDQLATIQTVKNNNLLSPADVSSQALYEQAKNQVSELSGKFKGWEKHRDALLVKMEKVYDRYNSKNAKAVIPDVDLDVSQAAAQPSTPTSTTGIRIRKRNSPPLTSQPAPIVQKAVKTAAVPSSVVGSPTNRSTPTVEDPSKKAEVPQEVPVVSSTNTSGFFQKIKAGDIKGAFTELGEEVKRIAVDASDEAAEIMAGTIKPDSPKQTSPTGSPSKEASPSGSPNAAQARMKAEADAKRIAEEAKSEELRKEKSRKPGEKAEKTKQKRIAAELKKLEEASQKELKEAADLEAVKKEYAEKALAEEIAKKAREEAEEKRRIADEKRAEEEKLRVAAEDTRTKAAEAARSKANQIERKTNEKIALKLSIVGFAREITDKLKVWDDLGQEIGRVKNTLEGTVDNAVAQEKERLSTELYWPWKKKKLTRLAEKYKVEVAHHDLREELNVHQARIQALAEQYAGELAAKWWHNIPLTIGRRLKKREELAFNARKTEFKNYFEMNQLGDETKEALENVDLTRVSDVEKIALLFGQPQKTSFDSFFAKHIEKEVVAEDTKKVARNITTALRGIRECDTTLSELQPDQVNSVDAIVAPAEVLMNQILDPRAAGFKFSPELIQRNIDKLFDAFNPNKGVQSRSPVHSSPELNVRPSSSSRPSVTVL